MEFPIDDFRAKMRAFIMKICHPRIGASPFEISQGPLPLIQRRNGRFGIRCGTEIQEEDTRSVVTSYKVSL
jgi:hypothetical protein